MNEIVFQINGEPYTQIVDWQRRTDHLIIKHQIETCGRALVVGLRGQAGRQQITEVPEPGEAAPWYGVTGGGYAYVFTPLAVGCALWVESSASHTFVYSGSIAPVEFYLPDRIVAVTAPESSAGRFAYEDTGQAYHFRITGRDYQELAAWPAFGEPLAEYSYRFVPTTIGTLITVTHHTTAVSLRLREDWD